VLAGYDPDDPRSVDIPVGSYVNDDGLEGMRLGVPKNFFFDEVDPEIIALVRTAEDAFVKLGADLHEIELPGADDALQAAGIMIRAEAFAIHRRRLSDHPHGYGEDVRRRLQQAEAITAAEYAENRHRVRQWSRTLKDTFDKVDLIISPSTGTAAPLAGAEMIETTMRLARLTYGWSAAGLPALSIPCGFTKAGLPAGVQLAAPLFGERLLLAAGAAYQGVTDWHEQEPEFTKTTPCAHES
jgi:aspartyl-tRNA(Asn)/glutamyl-tRNA(Gln) amidotransferase subunit A